MADKLVTIATYSDILQAKLAQAKLEDEGIKCFVEEDPVHSLYGFPAGIKLKIKESEADRALEILKGETGT